MKSLILEKNSQIKPQPSIPGCFENLDLTNLLNIITSILIEEYVQIAKDNPEIFSKQGGPK